MEGKIEVVEYTLYEGNSRDEFRCQFNNDKPAGCEHSAVWLRGDGAVAYLDRRDDGSFATCWAMEDRGDLEFPYDSPVPPVVLCALHKALAEYEKEIAYEPPV